MKIGDIFISTIDLKKLATALGYSRNIEMPDSILQRYQELFPKLPKIVHAVSLAAKIESCDNDRVVTDKGTIRSPVFSKVARKARSVVYGLVTAGEILDTIQNNCQDTFDALIIDAYGAVLVEQGVDHLLELHIQAPGQHISLPFSPGYCDFPISEQTNLLAAFGTNPLGITCHHQSLMMTPVKTISFVAAVGEIPLDLNPCTHCTLARCQMRRKG